MRIRLPWAKARGKDAVRKHGSSKLRRKETLTFWAFIGPNLFLFGVFTFWPLIASGSWSFTKWDLISPTKTWVGLENYRRMLDDPVLWRVVRNTLWMGASAIIIRTPLALILAVLLNRRLFGSQFFRAVIFSPRFTNRVAIAMIWAWIFDGHYGLLRAPLEMLGLKSPDWLLSMTWSLPAVIIVLTWGGLGYSMVIFLAGLQSIPRVLYEAAKVDGASEWVLFSRITLPMVSPTTFFVMITSVISSLQVFAIPDVLTDGGPLWSSGTYLLYLYDNAFNWFRVGYGSALAVVLFLFILLITFVQNRLSKSWVHYG
jgi:ABC-type sugar transport system permease subunit